MKFSSTRANKCENVLAFGLIMMFYHYALNIVFCIYGCACDFLPCVGWHLYYLSFCLLIAVAWVKKLQQ